MTQASDTGHMPQLNTRSTRVAACLVAGVLPAILSLVLGQGPWTPYTWLADIYVRVAALVWGTLGSWTSSVWSVFF